MPNHVKKPTSEALHDLREALHLLATWGQYDNPTLYPGDDLGELLATEQRDLTDARARHAKALRDLRLAGFSFPAAWAGPNTAEGWPSACLAWEACADGDGAILPVSARWGRIVRHAGGAEALNRILTEVRAAILSGGADTPTTSSTTTPKPPAKRRGARRKFDPAKDAKRKADWEASGMTKEEFDRAMPLENDSTFAAVHRHNARQSRKRRG